MTGGHEPDTTCCCAVEAAGAKEIMLPPGGDYELIGSTFGVTQAGDLGAHQFVVPTPAINSQVARVIDVEKTCDRLCGPKVCKGLCGRPINQENPLEAATSLGVSWGPESVTRDGTPAPFVLVQETAPRTKGGPQSYSNGTYGDSDFDMCHFNSLTGAIQYLLRIAICISTFCCIARTDFSLPILLYAYYEWSICGHWRTDKKILYEVQDQIPRAFAPSAQLSYRDPSQAVISGSSPTPITQQYYHQQARSSAVSRIYQRTSGLLVASEETIRGVGLSAVLLTAALVADLFFLLFATATWTCAFAPDEDCLTGGLLQTQSIHQLVLAVSAANLCLVALITLGTWVWLRIQKESTAKLQRTAL